MYFKCEYNNNCNKELKMESENLRKIKRSCVVRQGKKSFFPSTIPKLRSSRATHLMLIIVSLLFGTLLWSDNKIIHEIGIQCVILLLLFLCELLRRLCLFFEEIRHLTSRYKHDNRLDSYLNAAKDTFTFTTKTTICIVSSAFYLLFFYYGNTLSDYKLSHFSLCFFPTTYILYHLLDFVASPLNDCLWLSKSHGLDYGCGMANSFFYGYLKLVMEKTGTEKKNLKESMEIYEDMEKIKLAIHKLFILIPKSMKCFVTLSDCVEGSCIEHRKSLKPLIQTVAGVQDRVYKNPVYAIKEIDGQYVNVCAEYATPLKTFQEVINFRGRHSSFYEKHKNDITLQFFLTLENLLLENQFDTMCELIYYDDMDENGKYHDVGLIILNRLKWLKKHQ